jgi:hypothetical protein
VRLTANVTAIGASTAAIFTSSNSSVAVDERRRAGHVAFIRGLAPGTVTITVRSAADTSKSTTATVIVTSGSAGVCTLANATNDDHRWARRSRRAQHRRLRPGRRLVRRHLPAHHHHRAGGADRPHEHGVRRVPHPHRRRGQPARGRRRRRRRHERAHPVAHAHAGRLLHRREQHRCRRDRRVHLSVRASTTASNDCTTATLSGTIAVGQTINGALTTTDCTLNDGSRADLYTLTVATSQAIQIDMTSTAFDAYLIVYGATGNIVTGDDNSGGGQNARVVRTFAPGTYYVAANTAQPRGWARTRSRCARPPGRGGAGGRRAASRLDRREGEARRACGVRGRRRRPPLGKPRPGA